MTLRHPRRITALTVGLLATFSAEAALIDLTAAGSSAIVNDAVIEGSVPDTGAGSGAISSFLRTQANGIEAGFNTDGALTLDQVAGCCTRSLTLGQLAAVEFDGKDYFQFQLDINESNGGDKARITLQTLELWVNTATGSDNDYVDGLGSKIWDLQSNTVEMVGSLDSGGSGSFDYRVLIPTSLLAGFDGGDFLYLYNAFGETEENGSASEAGFEEWAARTTNSSVVPIPAAGWLFGAALAALSSLRRRSSGFMAR